MWIGSTGGRWVFSPELRRGAPQVMSVAVGVRALPKEQKDNIER